MADPVKRTLEELIANGAPAFFSRDTDAIKARLVAKFEEISGRTLYPSQTEMYLIEVAAYALAVYAEAGQTAAEQNTVVFAKSTHLENRLANVSTFKLLAQAATTTLEFTLSSVRSQDVIIPAGVRTAAGAEAIFATDKDLTIAAGSLSASVSATAQNAGAEWNGLAAGSVIDILDPVAYVASVTNVTPVSGGSDVEDEERFRLRGANALFTIAKTGSGNGYREHVKAVHPDIVDVAVVRPSPGTINIYPLMKTGLPSPELKAEILDYLDPEALRAMGDDVYIFDPSAVELTGVLTVRAYAADSALEALALAAALTVIKPWSQALAQKVAPSAITTAVKALSNVADAKLDGIVWAELAETEYAVLNSLAVNVEVVNG